MIANEWRKIGFEFAVRSEVDNSVQVCFRFTQPLSENLGVSIVLPDWIAKLEFLLCFEDLCPLLVVLTSVNPSSHRFHFNHEDSETGDQNVVNLRSSAVVFENYIAYALIRV